LLSPNLRNVGLGRTTTTIFDELGRAIETVFHDGTSIASTVDNLGRRIAETDQNGNVTNYEHDELGRLTAVVQYLEQDSENPIALRTEYDYDELGRQLYQEDANDHRTSFEYDLVGRRTAVILPEGQRSLSTYNEVGNLATYTDFNDYNPELPDDEQLITKRYEYDERDRLIEQSFPTSNDPTFSFTYTDHSWIAGDSYGWSWGDDL